MSILQLSQIMIRHHEITSFADLLQVVRKYGQEGQIMFEYDLKPEYPDTPRDWEKQIEVAFLTPK